MTYDNFKDYIKNKCNYETIYSDGEGRIILVITLLDAYTMTHRAPKNWVSLTDEEVEEIDKWVEFKEEGTGPLPVEKIVQYISHKLREKNGG